MVRKGCSVRWLLAGGLLAAVCGAVVTCALGQGMMRELRPGEMMLGKITVGGGMDMYSLAISSPITVTIRMEKVLNSGIDPKITLLNSSGMEIGSDDDGGDGLNSLLTIPLQPGQYMLRAQAVGTTSGDYVLRLEQVVTRSTSIGMTQSGYLNAGATEVYTLSVPRPMDVLIAANSVPGASLDPKVTLRNATGAEIGSDDDSGEGNNALLRQSVQPGTYQVVVSAYGTTSGQYTLSVTEAPSTILGMVSVGEQRMAMLGGGEQHQYTLSAARPIELVITANKVPGSSLDPKVTLRNAAGTEVGSDDDSGGDNNARLVTQVAAGEYRIVISAYGTTAGGYVLAVNEVRAVSRGPIGIGESRASQLEQGGRDAYQLSVPRGADLVISANKVTAPASVTMGPGRMQTMGTIYSSGQIDRYPYQVSAMQPTTIRVDKLAGSSLDPKVMVYDAMGNQIASDDDGGEGLNCLLSQTLSPGTYTVGVTTAGSSTGAYMLLIEPGTPNNLDPKVSLRSSSGTEIGADDDSGGDKNARLVRRVEPGFYEIVVSAYGTTAGSYTLSVSEAVAQNMGTITLGGSRSGSLSGGERHTYTLSVPQTTGVTIDLMKSGDSSIDPELALRTGAGTDVATDDDGGEGVNSRIMQTLQPGMYQVVAMGHGASSGAYQLNVTSGAVAQMQQQQQQQQIASGQVHLTFEQDDGGFGVESDNDVERALAVGKYSVRARRGDHQIWSLPLGQRSDGTFSVTALKMDGPDDQGFGLCLRVHGRGDAPNLYLFEINGSGRYRFRVRNDANWRDILPWSDSHAIGKGSYQKNTLSIEATGGHFVLKINDVVLGAADDSSFSTGYVGLSVSEGLHILFDDFEAPAQAGGADGGG